MKFYAYSMIWLAACALSLSSCLQDDCSREVTYWTSTPVYKLKQEVRAEAPIVSSPRNMVNPGQFYYYQQHIFIAERGQGVHIIDNSSPTNPTPIAFLEVPGVDNIAVRNDILYLNNFIDLLTFDLRTPAQPIFTGRSENVFDPLGTNMQEDQIITEYIMEEVTEVVDCEQYDRLVAVDATFFDESSADLVNLGIATNRPINGQVITGVGGSMARFTIVDDYLYVISDSDLDVISLEQPILPKLVNTIHVGWGIETIFPYEDKLFIGSNAGMFIFDNQDPTAPVELSEFQHARACDPVFVKGNHAYVTLRDGTACQGFINQLDLIDISDLEHPSLIKSFSMDHPHGLTIRDDHLILCEGDHGLKAFDISTPELLDQHLLDTEGGLHAWDAISLPVSAPITIVIGEDGFYQYEFDADDGFKLLSHLPIDPN